MNINISLKPPTSFCLSTLRGLEDRGITVAPPVVNRVLSGIRFRVGSPWWSSSLQGGTHTPTYIHSYLPSSYKNYKYIYISISYYIFISRGLRFLLGFSCSSRGLYLDLTVWSGNQVKSWWRSEKEICVLRHYVQMEANDTSALFHISVLSFTTTSVIWSMDKTYSSRNNKSIEYSTWPNLYD